MLFLAIGYFDEYKMNEKTNEEMEDIMSRCEADLTRFYESGHVTHDFGLESKVKQVKRVSNHVQLTDSKGTDEGIGSVFIIEAADFDEALQIASLHPSVQAREAEELGWRIEVRAIHYAKM